MTPYPESSEKVMRKLYATLSEKDRRRYAAVEAVKLGHGGITYVASILGCAQSTIATGIEELAALPEGSGYDPRIRRQGGGRKPYGENHPGIDEAFLDSHRKRRIQASWYQTRDVQFRPRSGQGLVETAACCGGVHEGRQAWHVHPRSVDG